VPDHIWLNSLSLSFRNNSFFEPSDRFPTFELDINLIGTDSFHKVEVNMSIDSITSEVERLVDLDEAARHKI